MSKKELDLGEVWTATRNALSKFNNYEGKATAKVETAKKALLKAVADSAAEVDKKRAALIDAMGVK
jgi:hypothetical protein